MKKSKKRRNAPSTPLAAFHKGSRDAEIQAFGKPVPRHNVVTSKKVYRRNRRVDSIDTVVFLLPPGEPYCPPIDRY